VELLQDTIENGKTSTNMKPFSRKKGGPLKDSEIEAIILFIRTWEELEASPALPATLLTPPTPDPIAFEPVALPEIPLIQGDATRGASLYARYCQKCHAAEGQGRFGPALIKSWPSNRPDLIIYSTLDRGVPGSLMPAWGQANSGPLPEQDLKDLTAFILKQSMPAQPNIQTAGAPGVRPYPPGWLGLAVGLGLLTFIVFMAEPYCRKRER
jgi:mono/diheme cytochrome c family protein